MFPSFSIPALAIAGLIATAAPILIHILNKRRFKRVDWAAMEFLRRAYRVRRRRVKLEELLLLAMRCLIVALFGAALAQPFFNQGAALGALGDARTDRIIVLDDSLSMNARTGVSSPAEEAGKLLRSWISELSTSGSADTVTLLKTSRPSEPVFNGVPLTEEVTSQILEELKDLESHAAGGSLASALIEVEKRLGEGANKDVNQTVYVISDMRSKDWASANQPGIEATLLGSMQRISDKANGAYVIDLAGEPRANLAIEDIAPSDVALVAGTTTRFSVIVRNHSESDAAGVQLSLTAGTGAPQTATLESIPAKGTGTATFNVPLPEIAGDTVDGEVPVLPPVPLTARISTPAEGLNDALPNDDERYFPARLSAGIRVLIVDGDPSGTFGQSETYFLTRALAPRGNTRSGVSTTVIDESEFSTLEIDPYQVIFLCNVYAVPDDRRVALENWVSAGGGLVVSLGDQIDQEDWNNRMFRNGEGLLPVRLESVEGDESEQTWAYFDPQDAQHPIFKLFEGSQNPLRSNVKVFQWWKTSLPTTDAPPSAEESGPAAVASALANFSTDDDAPAIVERPFGNGKVVAITTSMDVDWSNWPLDISFLVVMQEVTRHVAQSNAREGEIGVGDAIASKVDLSRFKPEVLLDAPTTEDRSIQARPPEGADSGTTDWLAGIDSASAPGFYTLTLQPTDESQNQKILYAANLEAAESDLSLVSRELASRDLTQAGIAYVQSPDSFNALEEAAEKSSIWRYVLYAVLALMAVELFYGWWISARRRAVKPRSFNQAGRSMARAASLTALIGLSFGLSDQAMAQGVILGGVGDPELATVAPQELSGAQLKTNEDIGDILAQADDLVTQKRYELATVLWQKALDTSADTLFTRDDWKVSRGSYHYQVYKPVVSEIEATLAKLPPEALKAYQLKADGDAEALLATAQPADKRRVLGEVTTRFFLSSVGDDSAFELACYMLDDLEYFGAARILRKLLDHHPSLSISRTEILKRLAVAEARSGGADRAEEAFNSLKTSAGALPRSFVAAVESDIAMAKSDQPAVASSGNDGSRDIPDFATTPSSIALSWEQPFKLKLPSDWPVIPDPPKPKPDPRARPYGLPAPSNVNQTTAGLRNAWKQQHLEPIGQIAIADGNILFRNEERMASIDASTGEARWLGMRSASTSPAGMQRDSHFFRDHAAQASLAWNGTLFTVEGQTLDFAEEELTGVTPPSLDLSAQQQFRYNGGEMNRARDNRLAAYDIRTGKLLWTRRANEPDSTTTSSNTNISFSGKPEPASAGTLAVAVHEGRQLWLVILDAETGNTLRRTQICQEPAECLATASVDVLISGSDALIATGAGAVACVDINSGEIRWCTTYTRPIPKSMRANVNPQVMARQLVNMMNSGQGRPEGWSTDHVFVQGGTVVLMPSDCDRVLAFSRVSGEFLWEAPKHPDGYDDPISVVGFANGRIFVRGIDFVRCYESRGGRIAWETKTTEQFGNGLVTDQAVYASLENAIIKLDAETGSAISTIAVEDSEEPPGSLYSDGQRIYSMSPGEVRAFQLK